jgi:hypothetical protein
MVSHGPAWCWLLTGRVRGRRGCRGGRSGSAGRWNVGGPLIVLNTSPGIVPRSGACISKRVIPTQRTAPVQTSFRWMAACVFWRLGFRQSSFHHFPRVPQHPTPVRLDATAAFLACSCPFTFRIQVSHQTQEPPSEFLPDAPGGIQQGVSRRNSSAADKARHRPSLGRRCARGLALVPACPEPLCEDSRSVTRARSTLSLLLRRRGNEPPR